MTAQHVPFHFDTFLFNRNTYVVYEIYILYWYERIDFCIYKMMTYDGGLWVCYYHDSNQYDGTDLWAFTPRQRSRA